MSLDAGLMPAAGPPTLPDARQSGDDGQSLVEARLARIQEGKDFPALSRQIIDTISMIDDSASSLQRLANVVLREYSLTLGVVRTANTAHYRRTGRPIQSATHAMMMLGARTVRELASSLLLFENYARRSPVLKELMVMSLITANHARALATSTNRGDPEEAHLCGMFRNLGEVLIACHFPDDYARVQERVTELGQSIAGASNAVLGFRYEDLAVSVSRHWGMPDSVVQGIRARPGAVSSEISAITAFSHDLTAAIYRRAGGGIGTGPSVDAERAVDAVIERHDAHVRVSREQVRDVVESALDETRELFSTSRIVLEPPKLKALSDAARLAVGLSATPTGEWELESVENGAEPGSPVLRRRLRQELEHNVDPTSGADLGAVLLFALEAALRGGPFDRVIACVLTTDRTRLVARSGLGVDVEAIMNHFDFPMATRSNPVVAALQQRHALYVPSERAPTVQEARWSREMHAGQFGVFPIIVAGKIVGCLYADREAREPTADRLALEYMKSLSALVVKAIEARRGTQVTAALPLITPAATPAAIPVSTLTDAALPTPEQKSAIVLRVLRGESVPIVAASAGVSEAELESWRTAFLEGAVARLGGN